MSRRGGIVNVTMVITEEKILSNIDKIQKMINPNSKKKIVQLDEDANFKDLVEAIKSYLLEYPNKKNFPINVYKATYGLVETATSQFEVTTKKIEGLIKQREKNIILSGKLKELVEEINGGAEDWEEKISNVSDIFSEDVINNLSVLASCKTKTSNTYTEVMKNLNAKISNLESNLHIEIDMERLEDISKALSFIGIEVADALKLIPTPEEQIEAVAEENAMQAKATNIENVEVTAESATQNVNAVEDKGIAELLDTAVIESALEKEKKQYVQETTFEAKPSMWQRLKNSKLVKAATFLFRIKIKVELPSNALPEGKGE